MTTRKLHTGFRLVPTSMTVNDLERCNSPYCAFSPNLITLLDKYVAVVEYRLIMSVNIVSQFQSSPLLAITNAPRGLSVIAELLVYITINQRL